MLVVMRAVTYSALFVGFFLVFLPRRILVAVARPPEVGVEQVMGAVLTGAGGLLALWCIGTFVSLGKGTPAPFDPPRRLVVRGPYGLVRNPMYLGATLALAGAALFYGSVGLAGYAAGFVLVAHMFVVLYEEPALRSTFGQEYEAYCRIVRRWVPRVSSRRS